jgi:hypothetical protein
MTERFCSMLDCLDIGFIPDGTLDALPLPSQIGAIVLLAAAQVAYLTAHLGRIWRRSSGAG